MKALPLPPERVGPPMVYVVRAGEFIKIGTSRNVGGRVRSLMRPWACARPAEVDPANVRLVATLPGHYATERALHQRFASARVVGEWFRLTPELCTWLEQVPA